MPLPGINDSGDRSAVVPDFSVVNRSRLSSVFTNLLHTMTFL